MFDKHQVRLIEHPDFGDEWLLVSSERIEVGDVFYYKCDNAVILKRKLPGYLNLSHCFKIIASTVHIDDCVAIITKEEIKLVALVSVVVLQGFKGVINYLHDRLKKQ